MMHFWEKYKQTVTQNCTVPQLTDTYVDYWRNKLFVTTVIYMIPLGIIVLAPGIYMILISDLYVLLFADIAAVVSLGLIAFSTSLSLQFRKKLFCISLYFVTIVLLYYLGSYGPGLLYLLGLTFFITLIFETKYGLISLAVNTVICILTGFLIHFNVGNSEIISEYSLESWIAVSVNLVLLSALAVILIPGLFDGLQSAFDKQEAAEKELKKSKAELENSLALLEVKSRELEQFAYNASHDLKEPLRMISGFMDLLQKKYAADLDSRAQKYINFAIDGAVRMSKLIDDLLDYSRVGRVHNNREQINLNVILENLVKSEFAHSGKPKCNIQYKNMPVIEAVPVSMEMLFKNLISNALKYQNGNKEPEITVNAEEEKFFWHFSVSDNGIGIGEEYFDAVFELFKRLHTTNEYPGSGMGLAICKKIVEQHGGKIWVESEPEKGSTFYFTIKK